MLSPSTTDLPSNDADDVVDLPDYEGSEAGDELTTAHYQRLQRAEDSWSKLREAMLLTTFQNEGSRHDFRITPYNNYAYAPL